MLAYGSRNSVFGDVIRGRTHIFYTDTGVCFYSRRQLAFDDTPITCFDLLHLYLWYRKFSLETYGFLERSRGLETSQ